MIYEYDLELMVVALENVENTAQELFRHGLPDWLSHRLAHIRAEARSLRDVITLHKRQNHELME